MQIAGLTRCGLLFARRWNEFHSISVPLQVLNDDLGVIAGCISSLVSSSVAGLAQGQNAKTGGGVVGGGGQWRDMLADGRHSLTHN